MDPNQPRRDACKVCNGRLPARKSRYCSRFCRARWAKWQRRRPTAYLSFLQQVVAPVPVSPTPKAQAQARALLQAGLVLAYEQDGIVLAIGKPGPSEYLAEKARKRREQLRAARAAEAEALAAAEREAEQLREAEDGTP